MEKITIEDFEQMRLDGKFKARITSLNPIIQELNKLEKGEGLKIKAEEWKLKTHPNAYVNQYFRKDRTSKKFTCRKIRGEELWVIVRIL